MINTARGGIVNKLDDLYYGLKKGTDIAKTVQYYIENNDTYALKHLHIRAKRNWKIINKQGNTLFRITDNGNIYIGGAHPLYDDRYDGLNYVDQLDTTDEIKIDCSVADKVSGTLSIMEIT